MGIHLLGLPVVAFITLSQARYGAQLSGLRAVRSLSVSLPIEPFARPSLPGGLIS